MNPDSLAEQGAQALLAAFDDFQTRFKDLTKRAKTRFENRDWAGMQKDSAERLDLYKERVDHAVPQLRTLLGARALDRALWLALRRQYVAFASIRDDRELTETFFNSVTRRVLSTVGIDKEIDFVDAAGDFCPIESPKPIYKSYPGHRPLKDIVVAILTDYPFRTPYKNMAWDAQLAAERVQTHLKALGRPDADCVEIVKPPFFRSNGCYLVGRIRAGAEMVPLVLALRNAEDGIVLDAALTDPNDVSVVFSFTRSYFHVNVHRPRELVEFLRTMMPQKPVSELYISIGYNKHGKTELYRDLVRHMETSTEKFEAARGERGMVMAVFTLPSYDVVFKLIKDRFSYTKKTTRPIVMDKYRLVFKHDRAGRLVDAQEFEHFEFRKDRFSDDLLKTLLEEASSIVHVEGDTVVVDHLYTERRITPLNLYVREAPADKAREAVMDYGNAIKDLAAADIFPGDILLKNFGVTRHERVVFYDYDELCLLTDCNIRAFPAPTSEDEELGAEPWYYVQDNDIFPEEFRTFQGFEGELKEVFLKNHSDLFTVDYWQTMQERLKRGEIFDILPYKPSRRLRGSA